MLTLSLESANRLLSLADFALAVANVTNNAAVKAQAIEAIAELFALARAEEERAAKDKKD